MSSSRFILLGVRRDKTPTFLLTDCSSHFQVITGLILQQPHRAVTLISSWDIWGNWGPDSKGLAEGTHVIKVGVRLAFQDWICCGVFGDRIKLIRGPWGQSRPQVSRVGNWRPEKSTGLINELFERTLESLINLWFASPKILGYFPSLFLSHIHSQKYTHIPKSEFPRQ